MNKPLENYVRKILEFGCNIKPGDNIYIYTNDECKDLLEAIHELKDEYGIKKIDYVHSDYKKLYDFFGTHPTRAKIRQNVEEYPKITDKSKTKVIFVLDDDHSGYYRKLNDDYLNKLWISYKQNHEVTNKDFWDNFENMYVVTVNWPNKYWAKTLLGSEEKTPELFDMINSTVPSSLELREHIQRLKELKNKLNKSNITNLHFYTNLGTDLNIKLTNNSIWQSTISRLYNQDYFANFPSYELFTSPNCYSAEGKVVITKPSNFNGVKVNEAEMYFKKGKLVHCDSDNDLWAEMVSYHPHMDRIGEIAIVPHDSPVARTNRVYDSLLLDENSGCHLALGDSFAKCIKVPKELLENKGFSYYKFNQSNWHQDLVFGNESTFIEATTKNKRRILLMEHGKWRI